MHAIEAREQRNAFGAALFMHGLLAAGLLLSLSWSQKPPPIVQVELWSSPPADRPNAPFAPPPAPAPAPKPAPEPPTPPPLQPKADIAVQKKPEPPKRDLQEEARREAAKKEAAEKAAQKKLAEKKAAQELARLLNPDNKAKPADRGKDVATKAGAAQGAEVGAKTGVDADYVALIQARIRARITYADRAPGNPEAIVIVDQLPSGEVTRVQLSKSSGIPTWDQAVQRAIWAASPLPKKQDGTVARTLELRFRPKEVP